MEFYFSVADLLDKIPNKIGLTFIPIFVFTIFAEAIVIHGRHGNYSWKSTGVSSLLAIGHILTQAAAHGLIFGVIAAGVYAVRLTTTAYRMTADDEAALRAVGFDDRGVLQITLIAAWFNYVNRVADALGVGKTSG